MSKKAVNVHDTLADARRYRELERRVKTFEASDGTYMHCLLLSVRSESPDPGEAIDELMAKRKGK